MRNRLQYIYSILVFFGVLVTSYLMMGEEGYARLPLPLFQASVPTFQRQATLGVDPAVNQLFKFQDALRGKTSLPAESALDSLSSMPAPPVP